jgi:hypothetical protein
MGHTAALDIDSLKMTGSNSRNISEEYHMFHTAELDTDSLKVAGSNSRNV